MKKAYFLCLCIFLFSNNLFSQQGWSCSNPIPVTPSQSWQTLNDFTNCDAGAWYSITPTVNCEVQFCFLGTGLEIYDDCVFNQIFLGETNINCTTPCNYSTTIQKFAATASNTYYIKVCNGILCSQVSVRCVPTGGGPGSNCNDAIAVTPSQSWQTLNDASGCDPGTWYSITPTTNCEVEFCYVGTGLDVYDDCVFNPITLSSTNDNCTTPCNYSTTIQEFTATAFNTYFIKVCNGILCSQVNVRCIPIVVTNPCNSVISAVCDETKINQSTFEGANNFNPTNFPNCFPAGTPPTAFGARDKFYQIILQERSNLRVYIDIISPNTDLDLILLNSCLAGTQSFCMAVSQENNPALGVYKEGIDVVLNPGTYYFVVDGLTTADEGFFHIEFSCECVCVESFYDPPAARSILCENFDALDLNRIAPQSTRWGLWSQTADDAPVVHIGANDNALEIEENGNIQPDVLYSLGNIDVGRYRLSWRMFVENGRTGYYNIQHSTTPGDFAFEVALNQDGSGIMFIDAQTVPGSEFFYKNGDWNKVMHIIDLDQDIAELWINDQFVHSWAFSAGTSNLETLGAINFYGNINTHYRVDNICLWEVTGCPPDPDAPQVCIKNGLKEAEDEARCDLLYTSTEWEQCLTVCDFGGQFVYRSDNFSGEFSGTEFAPSLLKQEGCVLEAYDGNIPDPLFADIYIFYNDEQQTINVNFDNNDNDDVKAFVLGCDCDSGPRAIANCNENCLGEVGGGFNGADAPPGFYYVVVVSPQSGNNYGFSVTPSGPCSFNQTEIACDTNFTKTLTNPTDEYNVDGSGGAKQAYDNCYNGQRNYDGRDIVYKFRLDKPSKVSINLNSTAEMGIFLYDFVCGQSCIAFAENSPQGGSASLNTLPLSAGVYYLILDKASPFGSNTFDLSLTCIEDTQFFITTFTQADSLPPSCPVETDSIHEVGVENTAFDFTPQSLISFLYKDENGDYKAIDSLSRYYNGSATMVFPAPMDLEGDGEKCSYEKGDTFLIYLINQDNYGFCTATFDPLNPPGVTALDTFSPEGISIVNQLTRAEVNTFTISSTFRQVNSDGEDFFIQISSNKDWKVDITADSAWLDITPDSSTAGPALASITVNPNLSVEGREALLTFSTKETLVPRFRYLFIRQLGKCDPPNVDITGETSVCTGETTQLTAIVDPDIPNRYSYQWSTGDTTQAITVQPGLSQNYSVTVTDKLCFVSRTAVINVQVNDPPIAEAGNPTTLTCVVTQVTLNGTGSTTGNNIQYQWSTNDGNIVSGATTLTPTVNTAGTYTLLVSDQNTGCTSTDFVVVSENVTEPVADAGEDKTLNCVVTLIVLNANGSSQGPSFAYQWTTNDGNIISGATTLTPIINAPGTYTLIVTNTINGCTATSQVEVTQDINLPIAVANDAVITCSDPSVLLDGTGSSTGPVFIYEWTDGSGSVIGTELIMAVSTPDVYTLLVTNVENGCTAIDQATISQDITLPDVSIAPPSQINCISSSIILDATGSEGPSFTYSWETNDGNIVGGENTLNPEVNAPGTYTLTITNENNGCTASESVVVTAETNFPTANAGNDAILDCTGNPVVLDGNGSSMGANFEYLWTTTDGNILSGASTLSPSVDAPGTYTLHVTDTDNGCTANASVIVEAAPEVFLELAAKTDVDCHGDATGSATISPSGGTPTLSVLWSNGNIGTTADNLVADEYSVTVTDQRSCTAELTVTIEEPDPLSSNKSSTGETSDGSNDGMATLDPSGGTLPYTFEWSNNGTTATISNLTPGTYFFTITDDNNCTLKDSVIVPAFDCIFDINLTIINIRCFGEETGQAVASPLSGEPPYSYQWTGGGPGDTLPVLSNLGAGSYAVTVTDNRNCKIEKSFNVTQPDELEVTIDQLTNVECSDDANGSASVTVTGGVEPYGFSWPGGGAGPAKTNLSAGTYIVTIEDGNDCAVEKEVVIEAVDLIEPVVQTQNISVFLDENGQASIQPSDVDNGSSDNCGIAALNLNVAAFTCNDIGENMVTLTATDSSGNSQTAMAVVTIADNLSPTLTCPSNIESNNCSGAIEYDLPEVLDNCTDGDAQLLGGIGSGGPFPMGTTTEAYIFTDENGNVGTCSFTITIFNDLEASLDGIQPACFGEANGRATVSSSGGTEEYTFKWDNGETTAEATGLSPGQHTVTVTDANDCESTQSVTITENPEITLASIVTDEVNMQGNGAIDISVSGGAGGFSFAWTLNGEPFSDAEDLTGLAAGNYTVEIVDANGCTLTSGTIEVELVVSTRSPDLSAFVELFPNPTTGKLYLQFDLPEAMDVRIEILDVLGKLTYRNLEGTFSSRSIELDFSVYPAGLYLVKMNIGEGVVMKKVVKE